jgi:hypothetical protein
MDSLWLIARTVEFYHPLAYILSLVKTRRYGTPFKLAVSKHTEGCSLLVSSTLTRDFLTEGRYYT